MALIQYLAQLLLRVAERVVIQVQELAAVAVEAVTVSQMELIPEVLVTLLALLQRKVVMAVLVYLTM